jgi:hypothetical protein
MATVTSIRKTGRGIAQCFTNCNGMYLQGRETVSEKKFRSSREDSNKSCATPIAMMASIGEDRPRDRPVLQIPLCDRPVRRPENIRKYRLSSQGDASKSRLHVGHALGALAWKKRWGLCVQEIRADGQKVANNAKHTGGRIFMKNKKTQRASFETSSRCRACRDTKNMASGEARKNDWFIFERSEVGK